MAPPARQGFGFAGGSYKATTGPSVGAESARFHFGKKFLTVCRYSGVQVSAGAAERALTDAGAARKAAARPANAMIVDCLFMSQPLPVAIGTVMRNGSGVNQSCALATRWHLATGLGLPRYRPSTYSAG